ncbi:MAG: GIN domain-containing protein [Chitinophagaceae bacterium]
MNKNIFLLFFWIVFLLCACNHSNEPPGEIIQEERSIKSNFSKLKIANSIHVILTNGEKGTVVVAAKEGLMSYIQLKQVAEELFINIPDPPKNWNISNVKIYVPATNLEDIEVIMASKLTTESNVTMADTLELDLSGASSAIMDVNTINMDVKVEGASTLELKGKIGNSMISGKMEIEVLRSSSVDIRQLDVYEVDAEISGESKVFLEGKATIGKLDLSDASILEAFGLSIEDYDIEMSGQSNANIWCNNGMGINLRGASVLKYKGNPMKKVWEIRDNSSAEPSN